MAQCFTGPAQHSEEELDSQIQERSDTQTVELKVAFVCTKHVNYRTKDFTGLTLQEVLSTWTSSLSAKAVLNAFEHRMVGH